MIREMRAAIFDLDGVIVDTAKYHYLAWKRLANEHGFDFTEADNERLKGVSRTQSLEILLELGGLTVDQNTKLQMAAQKNEWYIDSILKMDASEILPGATEYLLGIRARGIKTALGSASKNAPVILERLGISALFDVIMDGNTVTRAKPDPEVFLCAARGLGISPALCVVFEDAEAGVEAARRAGMSVVGIGNPSMLRDADVVLPGLFELAVLSAF